MCQEITCAKHIVSGILARPNEGSHAKITKCNKLQTG